MTTALSRAVFDVSVSRLRTAFLAAASTSLLATLIAPAHAAPCVTTAGADTCIITLANSADTHDGQAGLDTLDFQGIYSLNASLFTTENTAHFQNFESAHVGLVSALFIDDTTNDDFVRSLNWTIDGFLSINQASTANFNDAIGNASNVTVNATGTFVVNEDETIGTLSGSGLVRLMGSAVLTTSASNNIFSGTLSDTGGITKTGGGKWKLTSDNSYSGATTVSGGTLEIAHAGAIDQSSSVTISGGGEITSVGLPSYSLNGLTITSGRLTGNAIINGNVSSNGGLQPGNTSIPPGGALENPGQDMGSITVNGNYTATGANAYVGMFINLDAAAPAGGVAGTTHDFLTINGIITGTTPTTFAVASFLDAPVGLPTTANGIQVIRVTGTNSGNDFVQRLALNAGPYQYLLKYVANYAGTDDGYFLQSAARDEIFAQPAILSAGQSLVRNCFRDDQRVPDSPKGATYGRAWAGYRQGSSSFGADTGVDSDVNFSCTTGGMDWRMGHGWFGGVSGGFGSADGKVQTPAGRGDYTGDARAIEAFASFTSSALFINLSAGFTSMDWIYNGALALPVSANSSGFLGAAQAGVALDLDALAVKLMGTVSYDGTNCSDACFGVKTQQETGLVEAKGTMRFDGVSMGGAIRPWAAVSYSDVLSDGINRVAVGLVSASQDANGQLLTFDAGMQAYLDQNFALFIDGGYHESLSVNVTGYKAGVGLKMYW